MSDVYAWLSSFDRGRFWPADPGSWLWKTLYLVVKEYLSVIVQLVCFSRVLLPDMFTGALIVYMMLVVFGFPFMSSYLFFVLRLGPWYNDGLGLLGLLRVASQILLLMSAQLLGALTAARFLQDNQHLWAQSTMTQSGSDVAWIFKGADDAVDQALPAVEEALSTLLFLMGLLHLMEADAGKFMLSAYWTGVDFDVEKELKTWGKGTESIKSDIDALSETLRADMDTLSATLREVATKVQEIAEQRPMRPKLPAVIDPRKKPLQTRRQTQDKADFVSHSPVPITFILHVCLLLAAIARAFPTAHGTPAITLFLLQMGYCSPATAQSRAIGGSLGAVVALLYYYVMYVWPGRQQRGAAEVFVRNVVESPPAFLELQLPPEIKTT